MRHTRQLLSILLATVMVTSLFAIAPVAGQADDPDPVSLPVGSQLSLLVDGQRAVVEDRLDAERYELRVETENATTEERITELRLRADDISADRSALIQAFRAGELSKERLLAGLVLTDLRAELTAEEVETLLAADPDNEALADLLADLDGEGTFDPLVAALRGGDAEMEARLEIRGDGFRAEVRTDGETRTEWEGGEADDDRNFTVSVNEAMAIATERVGDDWFVTRVQANEYHGTWKVRLATESGGEARVELDASTGEVIEVRERTGDADGGTEIETKGEIDLAFDGELTAGETVTVTATLDGEPVANATVEVNGEDVGTTDADGMATVTVPAGDELRVEVETDEAEGELRVRHEASDAPLRLTIDGTIAPGENVTVTATKMGSPVAGAEVTVKNEAGQRVTVGATDADGMLTVSVPATGFDLRVESGDARGELDVEFPGVDDDGMDDDEMDDDGMDDDDAPDTEGAIHIEVLGDIAPGATVTVVATHNGSALAGADVYVKDGNGDRQLVGQTDADGRIDVTVPAEGDKAGRLSIQVRHGELEGEFDFGDDDDDGDGIDDGAAMGTIAIAIEGTIAPGATVTVVATHDGSPVAGATVQVKDGNGERQTVGTTDANGRLDVTVPATGEKAGDLDVKVRKGELEGQFEHDAPDAPDEPDAPDAPDEPDAPDAPDDDDSDSSGSGASGSGSGDSDNSGSGSSN
ncbi:PepSY domain-containing protein [Natronomonas sp. EA1]|uniref:PepSY domain-containing protein n=1 Tax=Natronomonas sp. EA1 TaxID=3421655 RepID=UPI003EBC0A2C